MSRTIDEDYDYLFKIVLIGLFLNTIQFYRGLRSWEN